MLFSAPAMLWGLLAALVPVVIHLVNFRRYRKVYFSNVERLEAMSNQSRRHRDVRRWLVLAARVAAIVCLVLAFARPFIPAAGSGALRSGATAVSIYVDNTFSMESAASGGSRLDAARDKAREVAAAYRSADRFQLLTADLSGEEMRWLSREELADALDALRPTAASPMLSEVVRRQTEMLRQSGAANRHAFVISDFQRGAADVDRLGADTTCLVTLMPLAGNAADNLYIDTVRLDAPAYFAGAGVGVEVTVRNSGGSDAEGVPLRLYVGGRERAVATADLPAGGAAKVAMRFTIDSAGWADARVELTDYPVTFDDRYWFALRCGARIEALELYGREPNANLRRLFGQDSAVAWRSEPQGAYEGSLGEYSFIVLHEPKAIGSGLAQQLGQWVAGGGSLLVVPPPEAQPDGLNDLLGTLGAPQLDRWVGHSVRASGIDTRAALYTGVFGATDDDMELPTTQGHYTLGAGAMHHIIDLADGGTLLGSTPYGEGRLYLFSTPIDAAWTDFAGQALFVPTVYNMALYSQPVPAAAHTIGDPTPIALGTSHDPNARPPELTDGEGYSAIADLRRAGGRTVMVPHGDLPHDGIYSLADERLAFNYSRRESVMDFLDAAEVAKGVEGKEGYAVMQATARPLTDELEQRRNGRSLWRLFVVLALVALAAEVGMLKLKV